MVYAFVAIAQLLELLYRFLPQVRLLKEIALITSYLANLSPVRSFHWFAFPLLVDVISDTPFIGFGSVHFTVCPARACQIEYR
jgi:hypothetical protein